MSLYKDIQIYAKPTNNEVALFGALLKAFSTIGDTYQVHGKKYQVKFDNPLNTKAAQKSCEIADLLLFVYDGVNARFTFLQNKKAKPRYIPNGTIDIPVRQRFLLGNYPDIYPAGKIVFPQKLFSTHILDSIGSLGVFYTDPMGQINMDYSVMSLMSCLKTVNWLDYDSNASAKHVFSGIIGKVNKVKGYKEVEACSTLNDFEKHLINMEIGEPITSSNGATVHRVLEIVVSALKSIKTSHTSVSDIIKIQMEFDEKYRKQSNLNNISNKSINNRLKDFNDDEVKLNVVVINASKAREIYQNK